MNAIENIIKQNINIKNQIEINNNILKSILANQSQFDNNLNILSQQGSNNLNGINEFNFNNETKNVKMTNLHFERQDGLRINLVIPMNIKIKELFLKYIIRVGLDEKVLREEKIVFLFNGFKMNIEDDRTFLEYLEERNIPFQDCLKILVFYTKYLIC